MTTRGDLLKQQEELQVEAGAVGADLRLDEVLSAVGDPVRVGSAALGVMVRRDLDITVLGEPPRAVRAALGQQAVTPFCLAVRLMR
jgi:hypothetical protein